jgi:hypothetical protein
MKTIPDPPEWYKQLEAEPHTVYTFTDQLARSIKIKANQRKNRKWPVSLLSWLSAVMAVAIVGGVMLNYTVIKDKTYPVYQSVGRLLGFAVGDNNPPINVPSRPEVFLQKVNIDLDYVQSVQKGLIPGIEYGPGSSRKEMVSRWGRPDSSTESMDQWGNYVFYYDLPEETVSSVHIESGSLAIQLEEVKQRLGPPIEEGESETDTRWVLHYGYGDYQILFYGNQTSREVTSVSMSKSGQ